MSLLVASQSRESGKTLRADNTGMSSLFEVRSKMPRVTEKTMAGGAENTGGSIMDAEMSCEFGLLRKRRSTLGTFELVRRRN